MQLTPADVMALRLTKPKGGGAALPSHLSRVYIVPEGDEFCVVIYGNVQCRTGDIRLASALVRAEQQCVGYLAMLLNSHQDADEVLMDPEVQAQRLAARRAAYQASAERSNLEGVGKVSKSALQALTLSDLGL